MEVHQTTPMLDVADAVGDCTLNIQQILRENGFKSEIYSENAHGSLRGLTKNYKELYKTKGLLIHHFSIGSYINDFVNSLPNKKILIYHNITPPHFFSGYNDTIFYLCQTGREQLKRFKNNVISAVGDSEYNRKELEELGFDKTYVIPFILDFSKFKRFNKEIYKKFNDGKTNILFVGRIAPNKKFDDLIKIFYYYNTYMNNDSRLILVGPELWTGEIYYNYLTKLIKNLKLEEKVVFTGKVCNPCDLSSYYRVATNFLCMSEHEGFCIPLTEAMFFKVPIIAYSSTAVPETLGNSGVLVNKKNYEEIAELINIVNSDSSLRNSIIKGQTKRLKDFDHEKVKRSLKKLIYKLIES